MGRGGAGNWFQPTTLSQSGTFSSQSGDATAAPVASRPNISTPAHPEGMELPVAKQGRGGAGNMVWKSEEMWRKEKEEERLKKEEIEREAQGVGAGLQSPGKAVFGTQRGGRGGECTPAGPTRVVGQGVRSQGRGRWELVGTEMILICSSGWICMVVWKYWRCACRFCRGHITAWSSGMTFEACQRRAMSGEAIECVFSTCLESTPMLSIVGCRSVAGSYLNCKPTSRIARERLNT
jgi:hypothetical protein